MSLKNRCKLMKSFIISQFDYWLDSDGPYGKYQSQNQPNSRAVVCKAYAYWPVSAIVMLLFYIALSESV